MNIEIILQRHGESLGNAKKMYLGSTDLGLSEKGFFQAESAACAIENVRLDAVYSSDLKRAYNTALPHARLRGLEVVCVPGMRELFIGDWEGMTIYELVEKYGELFSVGWQQNFGTFKAPNGESVPELADRIFDTVFKIAQKHLDGERLLIVTHAAAIRSFWGKISDIDPAALANTVPFPTNASFTRVVYNGERLIPISYSEEK